jgi:ribosome-associated heat shock protein Hsp15
MQRVRIDKWLWAARFFKTRSLAAQAVEAGRVKVNGERAKPAKEVRVDDLLEVRNAEVAWQVTVSLVSSQRAAAPIARTLYAETAASIEARALAAAQRRLQREPAADLHGRPTKRDRRMIHRFSE